MKKLLLFTFVALFLSKSVQSQNCLPNGITFLTQAQVDNFSSTHPGCTVIEGEVNIGIVAGSGTNITNLNGLSVLTAIGGNLNIQYNPMLTSLSGLGNLTSVGGDLVVQLNDALPSLSGLGNITSIGGSLDVENNPLLTNLDGLEQITTVTSLRVGYMNQLTSLSALQNITTVQGNLFLGLLPQITNLDGLENINSIGGLLEVYGLSQITSLSVFGNVSTVNGGLDIWSMPLLTSLDGMQNISFGPGELSIIGNPLLASLSDLGNFPIVGNMFINDNDALTDLSGLESITTAGTVSVSGNAALTSLNGLDNLINITMEYQGDDIPLLISDNPLLASLSSLQSLLTAKGIQVYNNASLSYCNIYAVCDRLLNEPASIIISGNAAGCNTPAEVAALCASTPVLAEVRLDNNNNCQADATDGRAYGVQVRLDGAAQMNLRATDANGQVHFGYLENGVFSMDLPQLPSGHWAVCQEPVLLDPNNFTDTAKTIFVLSPLIQCPELTVDLGLPSFFRGCLVNSTVNVSVTNTGTIPAQGVTAAVVMPPTLQLVSSTPALASQTGDTYFFNLGDLQPFVTGTVQITVKTDCNTFLIGQTLCVEASASLDNPCPNTLPAHSEIKLSSECIGGNTVRFTLKNIGDAPTQGWHEYKIIRNESISNSNTFFLNPQESMVVDVPADGATYRMEATKFDDQTQTATAIENCGGLTPGLINAFWQDEGPLEYDFGCREVRASFDPNMKSATPTGAGWNGLISANRPLEYTIDFQNTGTDTAFRVLLRDELPQGLDLNTFRPISASHAFTWEIRGLNTLEVLFSPIALPHGSVNEPASHGFFTFSIDQKPNLPEGTNFYNTASIIFDFNPPILTNFTWHTIGQLAVSVDEAQAYASLWRVWGNPVQEVATFRTEAVIAGEKRFELYDATGRLLRSVQFSGQEFDFQRDGLPDGLYFFRIRDAQGRVFAGKILVGK